MPDKKIKTLSILFFLSFVVQAEVVLNGRVISGRNSARECQSTLSFQTFLLQEMAPNRTREMTHTQFLRTLNNHLTRCDYETSELPDGVIAAITYPQIDKIRRAVEAEEAFDLTSYRELVRLNSQVNEDPELIARMEQEQSGCGAVDLRSEMPPVRDQQGTGWCYGYAAADLLSHELGENISAVDIAVGYQAMSAASEVGRAFMADVRDYFTEDTLMERMRDGIWGRDERILGRTADAYRGAIAPSTRNGGYTSRAIMARQNMGYCRESELPSDNYGSTRLEQAITDLIALRDQVREQNSRTNASELAIQTCQEMGERIGELFPNLLISDVERVLQNPYFNDIYYSFVQHSCKNRISGQGIRAHETPTHLFQDRGAGVIDAHLSEGKIIGINYRIDMLQAGREGNHASTVVGRRWNADRNQCEYLVRNSWGTGCNYGYRNETSCENGNIWVNKALLTEQTYSLSYIGSRRHVASQE